MKLLLGKYELPFRYQLTQIVLEKRPLNGCSVAVIVFLSVHISELCFCGLQM